MGPDSYFVRRLAAILLAAGMGMRALEMTHAQPDDYADCVALRYDHVRAASDFATTDRACSHALENASLSAEQRARAYYFRGLNHFVEGTRLAVGEMKSIASASGAARDEIGSALRDL